MKLLVALVVLCVLPAAYAQVAGFAWETSDWGQCSRTCGGGLRSRSVQCFNAALQRKGIEEACANTVKPNSLESCNQVACTTGTQTLYSWFAGTYGDCNRLCGGGQRTRLIRCVNNAFQPVDASFCNNLLQPQQTETCNAQACTDSGLNWVIGVYGTCSKPCDGGIAERPVQCVRTTTVNGVTTTTKLVDEACSQPKPAVQITCNTAACSGNNWFTGEFSTCTQPCGGFGTRDRVVECRNAQGIQTEIAGCNPLTRPASRERCGLGACGVPASGYAWKIGTYGTCSADCGTGVSFRDVVCVDIAFRHVDDSFCINANLQKPAQSQSCTVNVACQPNKWFVGEYGNCLAPNGCGSGVQYRGVFCRNYRDAGRPDSECASIAGGKPVSVQTCSRAACTTTTGATQWFAGNFGACQAGNLAYRTVDCVSAAFTKLDDSACANILGGKPTTVAQCTYTNTNTNNGVPTTTTGTSYAFLAGAWSSCNAASCGGTGTRTRTFSCVGVTNGYSTGAVDASYCGNQAFPGVTSESCVRTC